MTEEKKLEIYGDIRVVDHFCEPPYKVIEGDLFFGMSFPCCEYKIQKLAEKGVTLVVNLTSEYEGRVDENIYARTSINTVRIPIKDMTTPSFEQADHFCKLAAEVKEHGGKVAVHCSRGWGRTAVMIASGLIKLFDIPAEEAIKAVKKVQPHAFCTLHQEFYPSEYEEYLNNKKRLN